MRTLPISTFDAAGIVALVAVASGLFGYAASELLYRRERSAAVAELVGEWVQARDTIVTEANIWTALRIEGACRHSVMSSTLKQWQRERSLNGQTVVAVCPP